MASQDLKHRVRDEPSAAASTDEATASRPSSEKKDKKMATAKRGLKSLAVAVAIPLILNVLNIAFFGFPRDVGASKKPFWFPPLWALHATCLVSSILMGLSAWLVWAEGGFHRKPEALALYVVQMGLALAWDPIVFRAGENRVGMLVAVAMLGSLIGCYRKFKQVNPIAGDLVKICFAWAGFVSIVNLKLILM